MSEPFLGEIKMMGFNYAPRDWATCDGQILAISQNQALFALLGITYGGNGTSTFALPDLRGRTPIHQGQGPGLPAVVLGESRGSETVTLSTAQLPSHSHTWRATTTSATGNAPQATSSYGTTVAQGGANPNLYDPSGQLANLNSGVITSTGGGQAHNNMQPSAVINFCIALQGIFPSRS